MGIRNQLDYLNNECDDERVVLEYLEEHSAYVTDAGGVAMPIEQFWQPGDLARYRAAQAAWATDAPPRYALPELTTLLRGVAGPAGLPQTTFLDDLTALWTRYAAWMASEGRDPTRPAETQQERRARVARESMRRTRARRSADTDPEHVALLEAARVAHEHYLMACRGRREAVERLDAEVRRTWAAYEAARDAARG